MCIRDSVSSLLCADDTLIYGRHQREAQNLLNAVATAGGQVGMELHWGKFQVTHVNNNMELFTPHGGQIHAKDNLVYLGATIYNTGHTYAELNKRLGQAWGEFCRHAKVWKHTSISIKRKLQIFLATVTSKVSHSLSSAWFNKAEKRRLD
eukprot:3948673-Pyramimonas_sp.AAC.1